MKLTFSARSTPLPVLERGDLRIEWEFLDEGYSGNWNENDPEDVPLLRFTVYVKPTMITHGYDMVYGGEWAFLNDGSYCTLMPYDTPDDILMKALELIYQEIESNIASHNYKRILERLSWMSPEDFK